MFFTVFLGIFIILYCSYNLLDINMFVKKFHGAHLESTIDAFAIVGIGVWLIVEFFLKSGPVTLLPMFFLLFKFDSISERKSFMMHRLLLWTINLTTAFIILNYLYFNLNFWGK
jgi:hypothetical protein